MNTTSTSGWNRPRQDAPKIASKKPSVMRGVVAGLVVVAIAAACVVVFMGKGEKPVEKADKERGRIKAVTPAAPRDGKAALPAEPAKKSAADIAREYSDKVKEFVKKSPGTNKVEWALAPLDPKDPDNALRTGVVQELGSLLSIEPGEQVPPFPYSFLVEDAQKEAGEKPSKISNGNKSFLEALKKWKIAAKETDDEHRLEHKQKLIEAQSELLAGIDEGVSVNDSIRAAYEFRKNAYEMRSTIIKTLAELAANEEDHAGTIEQIRDMNKRLAEEGIKAIAIENVIPDYDGPEELEAAGAPENKGEVK